MAKGCFLQDCHGCTWCPSVGMTAYVAEPPSMFSQVTGWGAFLIVRGHSYRTRFLQYNLWLMLSYKSFLDGLKMK